ncbi:MAG: hypothetical protein RL386_1168, partial [Bacteroidota bacterium]
MANETGAKIVFFSINLLRNILSKVAEAVFSGGKRGKGLAEHFETIVVLGGLTSFSPGLAVLEVEGHTDLVGATGTLRAQWGDCQVIA